MPEEQSHSHHQERRRRLSTPMAIIIAGALIAVAVYAGLSKNASTSGGGQGEKPVKVNIKDVKITDEDPYIGKKDAPVTMAYWSDYQCPFCKAVEVGGIPQIPIEPSIPTLIKNYVDAGKLKIVFKDYPFLGSDSITAALYEHAVWEAYPDKFYTWRKAMYDSQDEEGDQGFGDETTIINLVKQIPGMDADKLKNLVASKKDAYMKSINADKDAATKMGITGTPGFIVGTTLIPGAVPIDQFTSAIDPLLK